MKAVDIIGSAGKETIRKAVGAAEQLTSGEIRVFIDEECKEDVMDHAAFVFAELGMHKTDLRNGVLIYLALKDHKFAIIGDAGIHAKVGDDFWNHVKEEMLEHFRHGRIVEGIEHAVMQAGNKLKVFFPKQQQDVNELPDDIVFGNPDK